MANTLFCVVQKIKLHRHLIYINFSFDLILDYILINNSLMNYKILSVNFRLIFVFNQGFCAILETQIFLSKI